MSYRCRELVRTLHLLRYEMTFVQPAPPVTGASGPQPSLIDVFKRHPKWKRRVKYLLSHPEVVVPGDKRRYREARSSGRSLKPVPQTEERPGGRENNNKGARHG